MNISEFLDLKPRFIWVSELGATCPHCGSKEEALFLFEDGEGHAGALSCHQCGHIRMRLTPLKIVALVSGVCGEYFPTEVSPYE